MNVSCYEKNHVNGITYFRLTLQISMVYNQIHT